MTLNTTPARYGFTGTLDLDERFHEFIVRVLSSIVPPGSLGRGFEFTTGAAVGVDSFVGVALLNMFPQARHRVIVPSNRRRVDYWWESFDVESYDFVLVEMPFGTTFRDRNTRIVVSSNRLIAFPAYPEEDGHSRRSGTWQTVRIARALGVPIDPFILTHSRETVNP